MRKYWKVYPTKKVKGFTVTYIEMDGSLDSCIHAHVEANKMQRHSGVKWEVKLVER